MIVSDEDTRATPNELSGAFGCADRIRRFRIVEPDLDGESIPQERWPWKRRGIYLSQICLAVHLSPSISHRRDGNPDSAKENLYRCLRGLHQTALEHGLICPVACVVSGHGPREDDPLLKEVERWGGDQDWHRGSFTLYVAEDDNQGKGGDNGSVSGSVSERLADLLEPSLEELRAEFSEARNAEWYVNKLRAAAVKTAEDEPLAHLASVVSDLVDACARLFILKPDELNEKLPSDVSKPCALDRWSERCKDAARAATDAEATS